MKDEKKVSEQDLEAKKLLELEERKALQLLLIQGPENLLVNRFSDKSLDEKNLKFELLNGKKTSLYEEKQLLKKIISELPKNYEPKYATFFPALGRLLNWSPEILKSYHKPPIAAKTINEVIYDRFPKEVVEHIHAKNPYYKWCFREYKNYFFLGEDGIIMLERFIEDAVILMNDCSTLYEFRVKHATKFGTGFQPDLFQQYLDMI